jgi:hypothetical protein
MNDIKVVTRAIWENRKTISFGSTLSWDMATFRQAWVQEQDPKMWANGPGWYWLECSAQCQELAALAMPENLPSKGVKFGAIAA